MFLAAATAATTTYRTYYNRRTKIQSKYGETQTHFHTETHTVDGDDMKENSNTQHKNTTPANKQKIEIHMKFMQV